MNINYAQQSQAVVDGAVTELPLQVNTHLKTVFHLTIHTHPITTRTILPKLPLLANDGLHTSHSLNADVTLGRNFWCKTRFYSSSKSHL